MQDRLNRTSICSIIFLDIIAYSQKADNDQADIKTRFNAHITRAIENIAANDRIILDTGDGAGIAVMGEPEQALFVAIAIRDAIVTENESTEPKMFVRFGINLGSVRFVTDINGQTNIIGDGINVAQRIMSFAEPNHILVSRSYHEVVSRLTSELSNMFVYSGVKADKHIREHEVYLIASPSDIEQGRVKGVVHDKKLKRLVTAQFRQVNKIHSKLIFNTAAIIGVGILVFIQIILPFLTKNDTPPPITSQPPVAASAPVTPKKVMSTPTAINPQNSSVPASTVSIKNNEAIQSSPAPIKQEGISNPNKTNTASINKKPIMQHAIAPEAEDNSSDELSDTNNYDGGFLTKDETGQQVILYGDAAKEARAKK